MRRFLLVAWLLLVVPGVRGQSPSPGAPADAVVKVRPTPDVAGDRFTLGEVADISSKSADLASRLAACEIGVSPLPGLTRTLRLVDISSRLRSKGFNLSCLQIELPAMIAVRRVFAEVAPERLVECARAAAVEAASSEEGAVAFEPASTVRSVRCAPGEVKLSAGPVRGLRSGGYVTVPVTVHPATGASRTVEISLRAKRLVRGLIAAKTIEAGAVLSAEDLGEGEFEAGSVSTVRPVGPEDVIGRKARLRIEAGRPILVSHLASALLVQAGTKVKVESIAGAVRIAAEGTSRTSGALGDRVVVLIEATKRTVSARVSAKDTVRLEELR
jgi:flagella basal body P-ring formation protein FlgA